MQIKNVGDEGVVRCLVLYFKAGALVRWSAEHSEVSLAQSQKREGTDIDQFQGLIILANVGEPKQTIGAIVVLEVFDRGVRVVKIDSLDVIYQLARVFNIDAKVRDVVIYIIFMSCN